MPRDVKLKKGFLTMDFGAKFDGYCADMTRTVVVGKADNEMRKLYDTVLLAQTAALEYLREGADAGNADKTARDIIDSVPEYVEKRTLSPTLTSSGWERPFSSVFPGPTAITSP